MDPLAHQPAERTAAIAVGWNGRIIVVVEWNGPTGTVSNVVWRNAAARRAPDNPTPRRDTVATAG